MKDLLEQAFEAGQKWERYQFREIDSALDFETWFKQLQQPDVIQRLAPQNSIGVQEEDRCYKEPYRCTCTDECIYNKPITWRGGKPLLKSDLPNGA